MRAPAMLPLAAVRPALHTGSGIVDDVIISCGTYSARRLVPHRNCGLEVVLVERGNLRWMVDGCFERVTRGDAFFTLPWQVHGSLEEHEPGNRITWILVRLDREYPFPAERFGLSACIGLHRDDADHVATALASATRHACAATPLLAEAMRAVIAVRSTPGPLASTRIRSLVGVILTELAAVVSRRPDASGAAPESVGRVRRFLGSLPEQCDEAWTLASMAGACGLKRTQFAAIVVDLTGETPARYLARTRAEKARLLLASSKGNVTEVALCCGFASSQYFANVFRSFYGMTPRAYRATCRTRPCDPEPDWQNAPARTAEEEQRRLQQCLDGTLAD